MSIFEFIDAERAGYPVAMLCRMPGVSRSGYYDWRGRPPSKRSSQDALLVKKIREIHTSSHQTYGYSRVNAELRSLWIGCGRRRIARSAIFEYLEDFYSRCRLHPAFSYQSRVDYKEARAEGVATAQMLPIHESEVVPRCIPGCNCLR